MVICNRSTCRVSLGANFFDKLYKTIASVRREFLTPSEKNRYELTGCTGRDLAKRVSSIRLDLRSRYECNR